jgi:hypothetical protein
VYRSLLTSCVKEQELPTVSARPTKLHSQNRRSGPSRAVHLSISTVSLWIRPAAVSSGRRCTTTSTCWSARYGPSRRRLAGRRRSTPSRRTCHGCCPSSCRSASCDPGVHNQARVDPGLELRSGFGADLVGSHLRQ